MADVLIEAGTLTASRADRVVSGLLLPYNERCRSNLGRFSVPPNTIEVPTDPAVVTFNRAHEREQPIGRAVTLTDTPAGVVAAFSIARTPEGDAYLDDVEHGRARALSAEVAGVVIRAGRAVAGRLFAAAAVDAGAFPSATLLAADVGDLDDEDEGNQTTDDDQPSDDAAEDAAEEESTVDDDQAVEQTAEDEQEQERGQQLRASLPSSLGRKPTGTGKTLFASLGGAKPAQAATLMAALDNAIATDLLPTQQQQWLGEVYGSRTYVRRFASLVQHADLSGLKAIGWKFTDGKTPTVAPYSGFPAQPASTEVKTEAVTLDAVRLAGAGAVDRAFIDFPTPEFWSAYFREFTNDYERKLDGIARDAFVAGSTAVTAGTVPSGVATAAAYIVDGAISILNAERDLPSFAIVGSDLYRGLLLTRADDVIAFLSAALGLEDGTLAGFKIVPSAAAALTGKVLVGTKTSATVFELPGSPVRVDTVNIATGGLERGVFGYHAELINDAKGLALVAPAAG